VGWKADSWHVFLLRYPWQIRNIYDCELYSAWLFWGPIPGIQILSSGHNHLCHPIIDVLMYDIPYKFSITNGQRPEWSKTTSKGISYNRVIICACSYEFIAVASQSGLLHAERPLLRISKKLLPYSDWTPNCYKGCLLLLYCLWTAICHEKRCHGTELYMSWGLWIAKRA
jgi:hypothetical protein